jgi:hypothetical protein
MSNTTTCVHCKQTLLTRDVDHYRDYDSKAVCMRCARAYNYQYVGLTQWKTPKYRSTLAGD